MRWKSKQVAAIAQRERKREKVKTNTNNLKISFTLSNCSGIFFQLDLIWKQVYGDSRNIKFQMFPWKCVQSTSERLQFLSNCFSSHSLTPFKHFSRLVILFFSSSFEDKRHSVRNDRKENKKFHLQGEHFCFFYLWWSQGVLNKSPNERHKMNMKKSSRDVIWLPLGRARWWRVPTFSK